MSILVVLQEKVCPQNTMVWHVWIAGVGLLVGAVGFVGAMHEDAFMHCPLAVSL